MTLYVCLLPFSIIVSRFIYIIASMSTLLLITAEYYFIIGTYCNLFNCSFDGHLDWLHVQLLRIMMLEHHAHFFLIVSQALLWNLGFKQCLPSLKSLYLFLFLIFSCVSSAPELRGVASSITKSVCLINTANHVVYSVGLDLRS